MTATRLKSILVGIVDAEDKNNPLTDEQITSAMKEHGANIDRRTTAYYRKELLIPPANERTKK